MRLYNLLLGVIFLTIASIFIFCGFLLWPVTVIKANVQPYKILTPKVKIGQDIIYEADVCKYTDSIGTVTKTFQDGYSYPAIIQTGGVKKGCGKTLVEVQVPNYIPPGIYHLNLDVAYQVNPLHTEYYHFETASFKVIK